MEYVQIIVEHLLPVALVILAGVLGVLGRYAIQRFEAWTKVKIGETQQAQLESLAGQAWQWAEEKAINAVKLEEPKPGSQQKLDMALDYLLEMTKAQGLPELARDSLAKLIEAKLQEGRDK